MENFGLCWVAFSDIVIFSCVGTNCNYLRSWTVARGCSVDEMLDSNLEHELLVVTLVMTFNCKL